MKLSFLFLSAAAAAAVPTASAFSAGYLSQLNGASVNGVNGATTTSYAPSSYSPPAVVNGASASSAATATATVGGGPSQELLDLWSSQVSVELSASQLYLSASIWFRERNLKGMSAWMLDESDEERGHGLAILEWANKRKFPVTLETLDAPRDDWQTPEEVWQDILKAEQTNTQNLLKLAAAAEKCGEYGCMAFLNDFHVEQIDAEDKVGGILAKITGCGTDLLKQLDHELGLEAEEEDGH